VDGDLDAAREALRLAWSAATWSASCNDQHGLEEAILVAEAIRDRSKGRTREEASRLAAFCAYSCDHPQPRRWFGLTNTRV
jgi:hypothetical protein